jgi:hypothetical protein
VLHLEYLRDRALDDLQFWVGRRSRRQLNAELQRIDKCAALIDSLNAPQIRGLMAGVTGQPALALLTLPTTMRRYTAWFRGDLLAHVSERKHENRDLGLCQLVRYVKERTGRWRDREVSALVAAVLNNTNYSTDAHKDWRSRNYASLLHDLEHGRRPAKKS